MISISRNNLNKKNFDEINDKNYTVNDFSTTVLVEVMYKIFEENQKGQNEND